MVDKKLNILTFDVEDWYHGVFYGIPEHMWESCEARVEPQLNYILTLLRKTNNKATFFTVASLARRSPEIIKRIDSEGHEIALHSYSHKMLTELNQEEFEEDIKRSLDVMASVTDQKISGFRAPYWSVNDQNRDFVVKVLGRNGFNYDSSIFPFKTFQYGDSRAPRYPNIIQTDNGSCITEVPPSILEFFKKRIPFSGGFYFRLLPYKLIKSGIRRVNKEGYPAIFYFHPYDIDSEQPRIARGFKERIILYANLRKCRQKFEKLLHNFKFGRMDEYVRGLSIRS
jgi:polysaccharide deacetylase family protein (PEP-CTERM system associated)